MTSTKIKHLKESESPKEHYFRVMGSCRRMKDGRFKCNLSPVEPVETVEEIHEDTQVEIDLNTDGDIEIVETGDDLISNDEDIDSDSDEDPEEDE